MKARFARLDDDLTVVWPETASIHVNRDQVIVAEDGDGKIAGGLIFVDGGHWVMYVESIRTLLPKERRFWAVKPLVQAVHDYARRNGRLLISWVVPEGDFADLLVKAGCEDQGAHRYMLRAAHLPLAWERTDA